MTDYFSLLKEPRRPWLDVEQLKNKFATISTQCHPDKFPQASPEEKSSISAHYAELNAAFQCLSNTRDRLLHLIELESGNAPSDVQRIPPGIGELFMEVGQTCAGAATFLEKKPKTDSPMLKAKLFVENMEWSDKLTSLQNKINLLRTGLEEELKKMNPLFEQRTSPLPLQRMEEIYRSISYISRWTDQIRERIVQLAE